MNWGAWRTTVHVVAKSQTRLSTCVLCGLILNRKSLPAICCPVRSLSLTQAEGAAPLPAVPLSDLQPCLGGHVACCRVPSCNRLPCLSCPPAAPRISLGPSLPGNIRASVSTAHDMFLKMKPEQNKASLHFILIHHWRDANVVKWRTFALFQSPNLSVFPPSFVR